MRVVVALGGNALLKRGEPMTAENQRANVRGAAPDLAAVGRNHQLVLSHGNGPQVGLLALQASAYTEVDPYPLDILGAQTEGMIGYVLEQELGNVMPPETPLATILTMVQVDPSDPAFDDPTKFVGPIYDRRAGRRSRSRQGVEVQAGRGQLATCRTLTRAAPHLRDPADPVAPRPRRRRDLRRRRGRADHVPPVRRDHARGGRGRHRQGLRQRAVGPGDRGGPVRDGHRRGRGLRRLGYAAAARAAQRDGAASSAAPRSRPARWVRRSTPPAGSSRPPAGARRSAP